MLKNRNWNIQTDPANKPAGGKFFVVNHLLREFTATRALASPSHLA
jgi:hypothetical protein